MEEVWRLSREVLARFLLAYRANTLVAYRRDLTYFFSWCEGIGVPPLLCTRGHLELYSRVMEANGLAPVTVARRLSSLSGYFTRAVDEEVIGRSPASSLRRPRVRPSLRRSGLTAQELSVVLEAARQWSPRMHLLVLLLALNGLRISELVGLNVRDVGTERGYRVIRIKRKGGIHAVAPLATVTVEALDIYLNGRKTGPLMTTRSGARMSRNGAADGLRRLVARALPTRTGDVSPHSLRRSFVTLSLDAGATLRDVQDAASHASADTTRLYDLARHALDRHPTFLLGEVLKGAGAGGRAGHPSKGGALPCSQFPVAEA